MIDAMYRELAPLYGYPEQDSPLPLSLPAGRSVFLVASNGGETIGCGAISPIKDDMGEVRRMYVRPQWRGRGVGKSILAELERQALALGFRRLRLESGDLQPAAIAVYERAGYRSIPCWGAHAGPHDRCYEKDLLAGRGAM